MAAEECRILETWVVTGYSVTRVLWRHFHGRNIRRIYSFASLDSLILPCFFWTFIYRTDVCYPYHIDFPVARPSILPFASALSRPWFIPLILYLYHDLSTLVHTSQSSLFTLYLILIVDHIPPSYTARAQKATVQSRTRQGPKKKHRSLGHSLPSLDPPTLRTPCK